MWEQLSNGTKVTDTRSNGRGLTLLEVLVALGIVGTVVLLVLGVLTRFVVSQSGTAAHTAAELLSNEVLERAAAVGPPSWGFPPPEQTSLKGSRLLVLPNDEIPTEFEYQLLASPLRADPRSQGVLWELEVDTQWWGGSERVERGELRVQAHRVVYVEN